MNQRKIYPNIDMIKTGQKLKHMLECAGYTPRMLQEYLHLSCVQPIYRWYKGMILPSVDHLLMISELLEVHMEELLVRKSECICVYDVERNDVQSIRRRMLVYYKRLSQMVA